MTKIKKIAIAGVIGFLSLGLFSFILTSASEVSGTLSAGASAPAGGGSQTEGTLSGGVNDDGTISGTVSSGSSSGGSVGGGGGGSVSFGSGSSFGGSSGNGTLNPFTGSVLGESIAQATIPNFPNTGLDPNNLSLPWNIIIGSSLIFTFTIFFMKKAKDTI